MNADQLIQEMQDALPDYIDREYPKGSADRGHATVHIIKFLLDYKKYIDKPDFNEISSRDADWNGPMEI